MSFHDILLKSIPVVKVPGEIVEETEDLLTLRAGESILQVPKQHIENVVREEGDPLVVVSIMPDAKILRTTVHTPADLRRIGFKSAFASQPEPKFAGAGVLSSDQCDCICDCDCRCECDCTDCNCDCNCDCNT